MSRAASPDIFESPSEEDRKILELMGNFLERVSTASCEESEALVRIEKFFSENPTILDHFDFNHMDLFLRPQLLKLPMSEREPFLLAFMGKMAQTKKYGLVKALIIFAEINGFSLLLPWNNLVADIEDGLSLKEIEELEQHTVEIVNELMDKKILLWGDENLKKVITQLFNTKTTPQKVLISALDRFLKCFIESERFPRRKIWMLNLNEPDSHGNDWFAKLVLGHGNKKVQTHWFMGVLQHIEKGSLQDLILLATQHSAAFLFWDALKNHEYWVEFDFPNKKLFDFSGEGFLHLLFKNESSKAVAWQFVEHIAEGLSAEEACAVVDRCCDSGLHNEFIDHIRAKKLLQKYYLDIFKRFLEKGGREDIENRYCLAIEILSYLPPEEQSEAFAVCTPSFIFWNLQKIPSFIDNLLRRIEILNEDQRDKLLNTLFCVVGKKEARVFQEKIEQVLLQIFLQKKFWDIGKIQGGSLQNLSVEFFVTLLEKKPEFSFHVFSSINVDKTRCILRHLAEKNLSQYWACFLNILRENESMANYFLETVYGLPEPDAWAECCRAVFSLKRNGHFKNAFIKTYLEKIPDRAFQEGAMSQYYRKKVYKLRLMREIETKAADESAVIDAWGWVIEAAPVKKDWDAPEYINPKGNFFLWLISKARSLTAKVLKTFFSCNMMDDDLENPLGILFSKISENTKNLEYKRYLLFCANILLVTLFRRISCSTQERWIERLEKTTLSFSEKCSFFISEEISTHLVIYFFECCRSHSDADKKQLAQLLADRFVKGQFSEKDTRWLKMEFTSEEVRHFPSAILMQQFALRVGLPHVSGLSQKIIKQIYELHHLNKATLSWLEKNKEKFRTYDFEILVSDEQLSFSTRLKLVSIGELSIEARKNIQIKMMECALRNSLVLEDQQRLMEITNCNKRHLTFDQIMPYVLFQFASGEKIREKNAEITAALLAMEIPTTAQAKGEWLDYYYLICASVLDGISAPEQIEMLKNKKLNPEIFLMYLQHHYGRYVDHLQLLRGYLDAVGLIVLYHAYLDACPSTASTESRGNHVRGHCIAAFRK